MANLGEQQRRAELGERVSKTQQETAGHEDLQVGGRTLDRTTNNHDEAAHGDGKLTTEPISDERAVCNYVRSNRTRQMLVEDAYTMGNEHREPIWYRATRKPRSGPVGSLK